MTGERLEYPEAHLFPRKRYIVYSDERCLLTNLALLGILQANAMEVVSGLTQQKSCWLVHWIMQEVEITGQCLLTKNDIFVLEKQHPLLQICSKNSDLIFHALKV